MLGNEVLNSASQVSSSVSVCDWTAVDVRWLNSFYTHMLCK